MYWKINDKEFYLKILKMLTAVVLTAMIFLAFAISFSTVSTTHICEGDSSSNISNNVHMTIEKYPPWFNLWSSSNGKLTFKIPLKDTAVYNHIVQKNDSLHIFKDYKTNIQGTYLEGTKNLLLNTVHGSFQGKCQLVNTYCKNNLTH